MARATPHIAEKTLCGPNANILVESDAWWDWLRESGSTTFRFESSSGTFTARRERKHGGYYWYAYRKFDGKLRKAYLGKAEELTFQHMHDVAESLAHSYTGAGGVLLLERNQLPVSQERATGLSVPQLLNTKLSIPATQASLLQRSRLTERLCQIGHYKLLLITAPAGSGKTTLLSEWSAYQQGEDNAFPLSWVSLDSGDNDLIRFWSYCIAALGTISPAVECIGEQAMLMLRSPQPGAIERVLTALINTMNGLPGDIVLVLDDYHLITSQHIHDGLTFLLDHLPPRLHLMLACRTEPPLPLARFRVQSQLVELHAPDLRFTPQETEAFLRQIMGLSLSDEHINVLEKRTEGWIAGLQLAALSLQEHSDPAQFIAHFNGSHRHIMEYLMEEVLRQQVEPVQRFLLYTSILDRLSGTLCDALTGQSDGVLQLEQVEHHNLFIFPLDEERRWYRYHHLFAGFLRDHMQQVQPQIVPLLHRRAADWYDHNGFVVEAIQHALLADDFLYAGNMVERNGELMFQRGEIMTLKTWIDALPGAVLHELPRLILFQSGIYTAIGQFVESELCIREAERAIAALRQRSHGDTEREAYCRKAASDLAALETTLVSFQGDLPRALALYRHALSIVPEEDVFTRSMMAASIATVYTLNGNIMEAARMLVEAKSIGQAAENTHIILATIAAQAYLLMEQGHLRQAAEIYRQGIHLATRPDGQMFPAASIACVGLGEILYQWNELAAADRYFEQGITLGETWGYIMFHARGYVIWARVKYAQGDSAGAQRILHQLEQQALRYDVLPALVWMKATQARLCIAQGNSEAAAQCLQSIGLKYDETLTYINEYEYITFARVLIAAGKYDEALPLLARLLAMVESEGRTRSTIEILTLQALALDAQGHALPSLKAIERALVLAEPEGFIRTFVEEGPAMVGLLMKCVAAQKRGQHQIEQPVPLSYVARLLELLGVCIVLPEQQQLRTISQSLIEPLSERELTVLQHLAAGLSNAEIADEMVVAVSTIKWHIKHIYAKLQVHSRTQVILKARELRLLPA